MDAERFYSEVKDIVLFPGSVDELNDSYAGTIGGEQIKYRIMPPRRDGKGYLVGVIVPTREEVEELTRITMSGLKGFDSSALNEAMDFNPGEMAEVTSELEKLAEPLIETAMGMVQNPVFLQSDLRMKAKKAGADGLVHVRMFHKDQIYMGTPVKRVR